VQLKRWLLYAQLNRKKNTSAKTEMP
jgi:hypothetical protein